MKTPTRFSFFLPLFLGGLALAAKDDAAGSAPVVMNPFKVDSNYIPKLSFGISLSVWKDNNTQKVISIVVNQVKSGSEAERKGLAPLARIERIDGRPAQDFDASFLKGTELNQLLVNRRNGDKITLEFTMPGCSGAQVVTIAEHRNLGIALPSMWEKLEN